MASLLTSVLRGAACVFTGIPLTRMSVGVTSVFAVDLVQPRPLGHHGPLERHAGVESLCAEEAKISALTFAVSAVAPAPTGPAATLASAPSLTLPSMADTPRSLMMSNTTSDLSAPAWRPAGSPIVRTQARSTVPCHRARAQPLPPEPHDERAAKHLGGGLYALGRLDEVADWLPICPSVANLDGELGSFHELLRIAGVPGCISGGGDGAKC